MLSKSSSIIQAEAELKLKLGNYRSENGTATTPSATHTHTYKPNPITWSINFTNLAIAGYQKAASNKTTATTTRQRGNNNIRFWRKTVFLFPLLRHSRPESFISSVALWLFWVSWRPSFVFMAFAYILHNAIDGIDMENMFTLLRLLLPRSLSPSPSVQLSLSVGRLAAFLCCLRLIRRIQSAFA